VFIPENERIIKENAHESIIKREIWDKVQNLRKSVSRGKADKSNRVHPLSGLLVCPDCGKKLKIKTNPKSGQTYFYCRTYIDLGKSYCSSHGISEKELENVVLCDLRSMLDGNALDEDGARENYIRLKAKCGERNGNFDESRLKACKNRLAELDKLIRSAFEERVLGNLPESVCVKLCENYQNERIAVEEEIGKIEKRLSEEREDGEGADGYIRRLKAYFGCEALTREACLQLINFITVGEKNPYGGSRQIHIYYNLKRDK